MNRTALTDRDLDAVICRFPGNVLVLTGFWSLSGNAFVVFPVSGPVTLIVDETEAWAVPRGAADDVRTYRAGRLGDPDVYDSIEMIVRDVGRAAGLTHAWIGIEHGSRAVSVGHQAAEPPVGIDATRQAIGHALPDASLTFAGPAMRQARSQKTENDIARLRLAGQAGAIGLQMFRDMCEAGRTEIEVATAVEGAATRAGYAVDGARDARAWAQLMTGPESARAWVSHPWTTQRKIGNGDLAVLELGTVVDGYWSDLTRTVMVGSSVNSEAVDMYDAVIAARDAVLSRAHAGMTGAEVDALARTEIDRRGFGPLFVHHTGHGLGFAYHENLPLLAPTDTTRVEAGMVVTVEPGLYREGLGGMRLEDNVVFTETGVVRLVEARDELRL